MRIFLAVVFGWLLILPIAASAESSPSPMPMTSGMNHDMRTATAHAVSHFWMPLSHLLDLLFARQSTSDRIPQPSPIPSLMMIPTMIPVPNITPTSNVMALRLSPRPRHVDRAVTTNSRVGTSPTPSPQASLAPVVSERQETSLASPQSVSHSETKVELGGSGGTSADIPVEGHSQSSSRATTVSSIRTELGITLTETSCGGNLTLSRGGNLKISVNNSTSTTRTYAIASFGSVSVAPGGRESLAFSPTQPGSFTISCGLSQSATLTIN